MFLQRLCGKCNNAVEDQHKYSSTVLSAMSLGGPCSSSKDCICIQSYGHTLGKVKVEEARGWIFVFFSAWLLICCGTMEGWECRAVSGQKLFQGRSIFSLQIVIRVVDQAVKLWRVLGDEGWRLFKYRRCLECLSLPPSWSPSVIWHLHACEREILMVLSLWLVMRVM